MTRPPHRVLAALLAAFALLALPLAQPARAELSGEDQAQLQAIEAYLNGLTTVQAGFVQVSDNAGLAEGIFYLKRPGKMRIEYDPPLPYLYVADGVWLTFWDGELEQRSDVRQDSTIAGLLTRSDIRLSGDLTVTGLERGDHTVTVDLVQTDDPGEGRMSLVFNREPLKLDSWTVVDAQGVTTRVDLTGMQTGVQLADSLFVAPRRGSSR